MANDTRDTTYDDTWKKRWAYLPRLVNLLWSLGPRQVVLFFLITVSPGLVNLVSIVLLKEMVDSALRVIEGTHPFDHAVFWLGAFLAVEFFQINPKTTACATLDHKPKKSLN